VVKGPQAGWGTCSRTVVLKWGLCALAYWKNIIAVGLQSGAIIILNAITSSQVAVLSGHTNWVRSLAFSSDGASLVSGSDDTTLKLWDVQTGGVVRTFHGHTHWVYSISISSDYTTIASASRDKTICLWDIQTRKCHHVIKLQEAVHCVSFSPTNPQHLISASGDVVQQWDTSGHQIGPTCEGVYAVFSLDGTHFVLCEENVVVVRNSGSGVTVAVCSVPNGSLCCCCFSPNGRLIAAAADTTVYIWDITSSDPDPIETFTGHTKAITSLAFTSSSSLISASNDRSVKFWQIGTSSTDLVTSDSKSPPPTLAPIKSITLQTKDGIAISSDSDGLVRTWDLSTGHCKASFQTPAKGSYQRGVFLVDSRLILVWCTLGNVYIQDVEEGKLLQAVDVPWVQVLDVQISGDGSTVFCLDNNHIQAQSMQTGEVVGTVDHSLGLQQGALLTIDGSKAWVAGKGWDFGISGSSPVPISGVLPDRPLLDFIGGVRNYKTNLPGIEDTVTRKKVFQLPGRLISPSDSQWDGQYLVAGYENGEVLILDFNNMLLQ
jgi:WD40 repeat protein